MLSGDTNPEFPYDLNSWMRSRAHPLYTGIAAHFSFLDPDHPDELPEENLLILLLHGLPYTITHMPRGFVADAEHPFHFLGRESQR